MDQANDTLPSSPTNSSLSSSDLDTESTGSFFHDRSTTLGTLMGVNFPQISVRVPSRRENASASVAGNDNPGGTRCKKPPAERRRNHGRRWWKLCREDSRPPSLGEFLEIERRFGDLPENRIFYGGPAELGGNPAAGNRALFADGRVLPPSATAAAQSPAGAACGLPVLFPGVCCGGGGKCHFKVFRI
ncbi:hypothetical protein MRB53_008501 [Persea americana]|uniref:Uncharacterized protein n=1 Tax=Persea americana TaxID=3435 RepID=A0ACC2MMZ4_PERAE|nr:hypothetical protein MRB53_008501 [Persea americana]|eukprot:TRINITY_DN23303_c0_g1_i1.p1 TRINITY_DN23303_c0_g1~~TRINITY_DN23303_c0_g1_i1.p1  ORF type:complete len:220 (+),score=25.48 TRINITY_DN23303_c0_g1_i1:99-662(+)